MANRYWNPSADANWADANVWATTFNGNPTGVATPTQNDDCFFTATNSHKCTIGATANCNNLYFDNADNGGNGDYVGTLAGNFDLNVYGNLAMSGGAMTNSWSGTLNLKATSGTKTIKSNGFSFFTMIINGSGGTFQLVDDFIEKASFTLTAGTFDPNGRTFTFNGVVGSTINGAITFYNLTITPATPAKTNAISFNNNCIVQNNLTISNGATLTNRILVSSSTVGTPRTITCTGASVNYSNVDFQDITIVNGTLGTNTSVGDCGGNTGITFTGSVDQHWTNASSGSWSVSTNWTSRVPLPQDNVFMDKAFGTSQTVTADMPRLGKSIDWTGATWTTALTYSSSMVNSIYGSLTLISNLTLGTTYDWTLAGRGSFTIKTNGVTLKGLNAYIKAPTGTYQVLDTLTVSSSTLLFINNGTLDTNNQAVNLTQVTVSSGATITLGSSLVTLIGGGNQWTMSGNINAGTSTIKMSETANNVLIFAGGSKTYNNIYFSRGASTGSITITGSNTFNDFKDDGTGAHSIIFPNSTTTVSTFTVNGTNPNLISLTRTGASGHWTLSASTGTISCNYIQPSNGITTGGATFNAYTSNGCVDGGGNTGWNFSAPPSYTLTYTAGANGTISGSSPQTVVSGGNGTAVTAVANTGYQFAGWSDGVLTASRTDTNVVSNITVTASFSLIIVPSSNAHIDDNHVSVGLGKSTTSGVLPLQIDAVTGRLMVEIVRVASDSGSLVQNRASKDANHANTMTGEADDSSGVLAVAIDSATTFPIVDLLIE